MIFPTHSCKGISGQVSFPVQLYSTGQRGSVPDLDCAFRPHDEGLAWKVCSDGGVERGGPASGVHEGGACHSVHALKYRGQKNMCWNSWNSTTHFFYILISNCSHEIFVPKIKIRCHNKLAKIKSSKDWTKITSVTLNAKKLCFLYFVSTQKRTKDLSMFCL